MSVGVDLYHFDFILDHESRMHFGRASPVMCFDAAEGAMKAV